ncbi:MAG TPA: thioredoxin domain-containing protein, partial [Bacillota bacterium]|nr:thioredoxin domain-containing protein [Bacillota bacterium]
FGKAKQEDKPIFLSIGYSTCHWCHVMERESFEDREVAALMNKYFVAIKVDREERPDVDAIYMAVCQALTGHGGWPLTIIMTPDKKPFFAGTYFPKHSSRGMAGIIDVLGQLGERWQTDREKMISAGDKIAEAIHTTFYNYEGGELPEAVLDNAYAYFENSFDPSFGGFGSAPKFPTPHNLSFLLRYWKLTGNPNALGMVEKTLESMYRGGMYDHIGFGFARYSTDQKWLVPHFEKMLYDNALLAIAYLEAFQAVKKPLYAQVAKEIFTYVLRDMTSPEGGFFSAEDADSEGVEGKFYVWQKDEILNILGHSDGNEFCHTYGITDKGNFEGSNIPNLIKADLEQAGTKRYASLRERLFKERVKRVHPHKDDKILTGWNGLMIAALSLGARAVGEPRYAEAAEKAAQFIVTRLRREDGRLLARYRDGEAAYPAYADDYAYLIWGLLELYQATFKPEYLKLALELNEQLIALFWDEDQPGLFLYGSDAEQLFTRPKEIYDGATPAANSVAALNFLRLGRLTGSSQLEKRAEAMFQSFGGNLAATPAGHTHFLQAIWFHQSGGIDVTLVGSPEAPGLQQMLDLVNQGFTPELLAALKPPGEAGKEVVRLIPELAGQEAVDNLPTAIVCKNFACQPPTTDVHVLAELL